MELFVGTSGWLYSWNKGKSLDWYISNSNLNAIELNASFYRFPFPSQVKHWAKIGSSLSWSIKVNRFITHVYRMNESGYDTFRKFLDIFSPLNDYIDNFLFQLPPNFSVDNKDKILKFIIKFNLFDRSVIEPRNISWFSQDILDFLRDNNLSIVSIDAPIGNFIHRTTNKLYLRMHGRSNWYQYNYSKKELYDDANKIKSLRPKQAYIFFNNDHSMLKNAVDFMRIMR